MGLASVARGHGGFQFERPERRDLRQRRMELTAKDFAPFSRSGFAKVAWNFKLRADLLSSVLSTETRIKCFAQAALWKLRLYWSVSVRATHLFDRLSSVFKLDG
jgi:hypothetical protein